MFSGLRSRWMIPAACAFVSPLQQWAMTLHRRAHGDDADARHALVERLALEHLHGDEGAPVLEPPGVVHVDDVGAANTCRGAGLAEEALDDDGGRGQLGGEHLHGDLLAEGHVLGLVHRRHAAPADLSRDTCTCRPAARRPGSSTRLLGQPFARRLSQRHQPCEPTGNRSTSTKVRATVSRDAAFFAWLVPKNTGRAHRCGLGAARRNFTDACVMVATAGDERRDTPLRVRLTR